MARLFDADEIESLQIELADVGRSLRSSFRQHNSSFRSNSSLSSSKDALDEEYIQQWAKIERLPTYNRSRVCLFDEYEDHSSVVKGKRVIEVSQLGALDRHLFMEKLIKQIERDNRRILQKLIKRIDNPLFKEHCRNNRKWKYDQRGRGDRLADMHSKMGQAELPVFVLSLYLWRELVAVNSRRSGVRQGGDNVFLGVNLVGIKLPTVEVRYENLFVEAECKVVRGKPLPTLWNSLKDMPSAITRLLGSQSQEATISILKGDSGMIKPGRSVTKSVSEFSPDDSTAWPTRMRKDVALVGTVWKFEQVKGDVSYNGHKLEEFVPQKTSAYISQYDLHIPEMTVRETIKFSARCQGVGNRADIMTEVCRREQQAGIFPDPDIDAYMKATSATGLKSSLQTDYILKILGLDICADTLVGDAMRRGISGGQKKRLTTGHVNKNCKDILLSTLRVNSTLTFNLKESNSD
ncbi:hypothetical protein Ancab_000518 [Ancistrocladus abbreviatus]